MTSVVEPERLSAERNNLFLYAMIRLRDPDLAEDAVQETLIAALEALPTFAGRSSLRTWLVAILRNKIADLLQAHGRYVSAELASGDDADDETVSLFDREDMWDKAARPRNWSDPEGAMEQKQFWAVFETCLHHLPARTAEVFALREVFGETIEAICKNLGITATNCSVMLFRARARLRDCLEKGWFIAPRKA